MKRLLVGLFIGLFLIEGVFAIRINEIELNPSGKDAGNEWIELYSEEEVDLINWRLVNNDDDVIELSQNFQGYLVIDFETQWLDNEDEKVFLYNDKELIDETMLFSDSDNNDKTWSYCDGDWVFISQTRDLVNSCEEDEELNEEENYKKENDKNLENSFNKTKDSFETEEDSSSPVTSNIIHLGKSKEIKELETEDIKTIKNIIYESKSELIKRYSVFGFALLCVMLSVLVIWNRLG